MRFVVVDASVCVKWFREETGSAEARDLLRLHERSEVNLWMPENVVVETVAAAGRRFGSVGYVAMWKRLEAARMGVANLDSRLVAEAAEQCDLLGCSFYDALAPALAVLLEAQLYSADAKAHGAFPDVVLIA